jgi:hypothetical protein
VICAYDGCDLPVCARGYCSGHYQQLRKTGRVYQTLKWKRGEGSITDQGYHRIQIKGKQKYVHHLIMEEHIGRPLTSNESVHHKNGNRLDNRIDNLELWSKYQPSGQRVEDKIKYAVEILKLYKPEILNDL